MGQYRPSNLIPSTLTSEYTIDATQDNVFSCNINGTSPTTQYRLVIMQNNTSSTIVYDTGIVTLSTPLYPVNYDGTVNTLQVTVPSTSTMQNGNEYKWKIYSYWNSSDYFESYDNVFYAYSQASVSINNFPNPITNKSYSFSANISQAQSVGVERFGWEIKNISTGEDIVNTITNNNIYSSDVQVSYDGFLNGNNYEIRVQCWFTDGTTVLTDFEEFSVSYEVVTVDSSISLTQTNDSGINVIWSNLYSISGIPSNQNYSFVISQQWEEYFNNNYLSLKSGNSIVYNKINSSDINIPTTVSHILFFNNITNSSIYKASGFDSFGNPYYIELSNDGENIVLDINGVKNNIYEIQPMDAWFFVCINQNSVYIKRMYSNGEGLYPSENLYPSDTLYPITDSYSIGFASMHNVNIINDGYFNNFEISGPLDIRYLWIRQNALTNEELSYFDNTSYIPSWDIYTYILATFQGDFNAGNTEYDGDITGWLIYRLDEDSSSLKYISSTDTDKNSLIDYSVRNQVQVCYYIFPVFDTGIGSPVVSSNIVPNWWSWNLITCTEQSKEYYYMDNVYVFDLDVTTTQLTNNTKFTTLDNFTEYAKIQFSNANYWSGSLSSLIGNCDTEYSDSVELMNKLKSLTNDNTDKFLKDRKGNLWKIKINSPITEKIADEYVEQAVTVTINWVEVGDASYSSIVHIP